MNQEAATERLAGELRMIPFNLLAAAIEASDEGNGGLAWSYMRKAQQAALLLEDDSTFNSLYGAAAFELARNSYLNGQELTGIQVRFRSKVGELIPGAKIVEHSNHPRHRPDFWVDVNGDVFPVEVKRTTFDKKAVRQLDRYMKFYDCSRGFAVAPKLSVDLPDGMDFIRCD